MGLRTENIVNADTHLRADVKIFYHFLFLLIN